jgi:predicted acylesterase/phospholipase RssA
LSFLTIDRLRHKRIGLVLSGGGAKGAYQVGCWKALRKYGVTNFAAVAGTSVGALNAVLIAANKCDLAESEWRGLDWREVIALKPAELLFMPIWLLAYAFSEFSPLKIMRISGSMTHPNPVRRWRVPVSIFGIVVLMLLVGGWIISRMDLIPICTTCASAGIGAVALLHNVSRRILLTPTFTTSSPLAERLHRAITEQDIAVMRKSKTRVYATLSKFQPYTDHAVRWEGWVPHYVRVDKLDKKAILDCLLKGSGFPGLLARRLDPENVVVDGGWTDNIPVAPIFFDEDGGVDVVFVINSSLTKAKAGLENWAEIRWQAHSKGKTPAPRPLPEVITVAPSKPLGHFYTGTCWFSRKKINEMMELGEQDMTETLGALGGGKRCA